MATVTKYLQDCDFTAWCFGGEDFAVMNTNYRNLKGQFEGAGLNLTQNKITAIGIYGEYKRTTSFIYPMGNTNRGATLYNGTSILTIGSAVSSQEDGDSKMSNSYASFTNYYTTDANIINSLVNQINSGLVVTIDLHADNKGGNSQFHIYGKNIRLVVTYEPLLVVTLNPNGGTVEPTTKSYSSGSTYGTLPTPTRDGYTFNYWTKEDGTRIYSSTAVTSSHTLVAQWQIKTYTVTFKDENGATLKTETVNHGSTATAPNDPVKADTAQHKYTFDGWYDANGNKWYPNTAIGSDTTYTARFTSTVQRHTVKWYNEDGSVLLETDELVPYGTMPEYNGETPTKAETVSETYEHIGWSIDVNSSGTTELTAVIESVDYYARFRAINKTYTVVWKNDDGTVLETDTLVPYGTVPDYNGAVPTKDDEQYDYTFLGWSANVEDTPLDDIQLPTVTGNITYTAVYTKTPKHFMVFVDLLSDKGEMLGGYMKIVEYGRETGIDAEEIEGYRFVKWSDGNTDNPRNITVTAEVTYQAIYERIPIPIIVNEEQPVTGVYIVPTTQTIVYVVSGEVPAVVANGVTVDDWSFIVSNSVPDNSYPIEKLYINETRVY